MNYPIRLRDEAERDITLAASWYEEQREGLGQEFLDELLATLQDIAEHPGHIQCCIGVCVAP